MTSGRPDTDVLFVSGFHRSGTTLVASALTDATRGTTLTVGYLAERIPGLAALLQRTRDSPVDRGVDRLPVTAETPEEYGWLFYHASGRHDLRPEDVRADVLPQLVRDIAGDGPVILKNPWDTGREDLMLQGFPTGAVILVRRGVAAIEDSSRRALLRFVASDTYLRALMGDDDRVRTLLGALAHPRWSRLVLLVSRWGLRINVLRLPRRLAKLPPERVAYLSYDELCRDAVAGAAWATHLLDPAAFAASFKGLVFADCGGERTGGWLVRALDARWERAWRRGRAAQIAAGILPGSPGP
jgi:hypothetical protein